MHFSSIPPFCWWDHKNIPRVSAMVFHSHSSSHHIISSLYCFIICLMSSHISLPGFGLNRHAVAHLGPTRVPLIHHPLTSLHSFPTVTQALLHSFLSLKDFFSKERFRVVVIDGSTVYKQCSLVDPKTFMFLLQKTKRLGRFCPNLYSGNSTTVCWQEQDKDGRSRLQYPHSSFSSYHRMIVVIDSEHWATLS